MQIKRNRFIYLTLCTVVGRNMLRRSIPPCLFQLGHPPIPSYLVEISPMHCRPVRRHRNKLGRYKTRPFKTMQCYLRLCRVYVAMRPFYFCDGRHSASFRHVRAPCQLPSWHICISSEFPRFQYIILEHVLEQNPLYPVRWVVTYPEAVIGASWLWSAQ